MAASESLLNLCHYSSSSSSSSSSSEDSGSEDEVFQIQPDSRLSAHPRSNPASSDLDENSTAGDQQQGQARQEVPLPGKKRTPYSLPMEQLPTQMRTFLAAVKTYFTQPVNLSRQRPPVLQGTFKKIQERLLCKYSHQSSLLFLFLRFFYLLIYFPVTTTFHGGRSKSRV